jgi:hypothetical protein
MIFAKSKDCDVGEKVFCAILRFSILLLPFVLEATIMVQGSASGTLQWSRMDHLPKLFFCHLRVLKLGFTLVAPLALGKLTWMDYSPAWGFTISMFVYLRGWNRLDSDSFVSRELFETLLLFL